MSPEFTWFFAFCFHFYYIYFISAYILFDVELLTMIQYFVMFYINDDFLKREDLFLKQKTNFLTYDPLYNWKKISTLPSPTRDRTWSFSPKFWDPPPRGLWTAP